MIIPNVIKKKTLWPPKGTESARWIPCLLTNLKKKREKKDCGLNCVENYLKSKKLPTFIGN